MKSRTLVALLGVVLAIAAAGAALTAATEGTAAGADPGGTNDPLTAARFELTIDGHSLAVFSELQGIASGFAPGELELTDRRLRVPGKRTPPTLTLKRGLTRSLELAAWHELALSDNAAARKNVSLTMYDPTGDPVVRYHLTDAWPALLVVDSLAAGASEVLMETVTIVAENMQRVSP
jgi:phage tail-like protein